MRVDSIAGSQSVYCPMKDQINVQEIEEMVSVPITRTGVELRGICVNFTATIGSATEGTDFVVENNTCCFEEDAGCTSCKIRILLDDIREGPETFYFSIVLDPEEDVCICKDNLTIITII